VNKLKQGAFTPQVLGIIEQMTSAFANEDYKAATQAQLLLSSNH